jgi:hypothetical protein
MLRPKPSKFMTQGSNAAWRDGCLAVLAWLAVPAVEKSLRVRGVEATARSVERLAEVAARAGGHRQLDPVACERAVHRAYRAHPWYPGGCLPRSLVEYGLRRASGAHAELVIGVPRKAWSRAPFEAHAWVAPTRNVGSYEPVYKRGAA